MDRKPTGLASPLTHCRLYMRRSKTRKRTKCFGNGSPSEGAFVRGALYTTMTMWDDKEEIEDGDDEENLDGQACKGRGRLHHQGVVGRLWVGGALGLGGGQLGASSGQGATAGWRGPKLPDSSRLPAASRDHLGRWQRITKWSPATSSSTKWRHRCPSCCHHVASTTINNTIG